MDKKTQAVVYGLDDASPLELKNALKKRKSMWRGLKFKLNLIIILLAANLLATLSIDIITWISTDLFNMLIALWNNSIDLFKSLLQ
ncbi:hypothetical protein N9I00_01300 [bacterium]|nr:hypothetical protein [bacterium]